MLCLPARDQVTLEYKQNMVAASSLVGVAVALVAQSCTLLYRRTAFGSASLAPCGLGEFTLCRVQLGYDGLIFSNQTLSRAGEKAKTTRLQM